MMLMTVIVVISGVVVFVFFHFPIMFTATNAISDVGEYFPSKNPDFVGDFVEPRRGG